MSPTPDDSASGLLEPGLRAARLRRGLTQEQTANLINTSLSSYRKWDRGGRPADPRKAQALVEVLETPMEILWPPETNPTVATALRALREQKAVDEARAHERGSADDIEPDPEERSSDEPSPVAQTSSYGLHRHIEATLDDTAAASSAPALRRRPRLLIPAVVSVAVVAVAGTAIATTGSSGQPTRTDQVAQTGPSPAERERAARQATLEEARDRRDYDQAITIAVSLNDTAMVTDLRQTAGTIVARRARAAAQRGDLPLATSRLDRAEERYGELPAIDSVRRRIDAIKEAREKRAAARKRAAKRRAAARAAAAAAARRSTPSTTPSGPSVAPSPTQSSPSPTPTPRPSPAPSSGSSGGGSSSRSQPKGDSSSGGAVDPGIF